MAENDGIALLAEAVARLEYKLDLIMNGVGMGGVVHPPMHFVGHTCPVCKKVVDYQIDIQHGVVKRMCGCKTGKQPSVIPLLPVTGAPHGRATDASGGVAGAAAHASEDRTEGKVR